MPKIETILDEALNRGASDLHLAAGQPPIARVRGELVTLRETPLETKELEELCLELLAPPQRARLAADNDIVFAYAHKDVARFRVAYFVKHAGLGAAFRLVPPRTPSLAELGAPEIAWRLLDRRAGLLLVAGGAASGRTTTVAAMIDHLNKTRACHILTIDDPVEFVHEPMRAQITQREVGSHLANAAAGMRNALREDADVVVVGDLRPGEAMKAAVELAGSGLLVIGVVAANGAVCAVERVLGSVAPEEQVRLRAMLADTLVAVVAQQLLRTPDAKTRVPVHEVLVATPAVAAALRDGKTRELTALMTAGQAQGMSTFEAGLERLLAANRIAPDVAFQRAIDKEGFTRVLARLRPDLVEQATS